MGGRTEDGRDGVASVAFAVASAHLSLFPLRSFRWRASGEG